MLRLSNAARKVGGVRTRTPYRTRKKPIKLTPEEKAERKAARDQKKISLNDALDEARDGVWELVEGLHAAFPSHTTEYFFQLLMQQPKTQKKRTISDWNAFLSMEMAKHNDGMHIYSSPPFMRPS